MSPFRQVFSPASRVLLAGAAGSLCVLAFAPYALAPLAFLALALFYGVLTGTGPRQAFLIGWGFGIGLMGWGISWVRISLDLYGNMPPWLAHLATFLLVMAMALYYGVAGLMIARLDRGKRWIGPLLVFPAVLVLTEWLRGWLFTGFPWLAIGYTQMDTPLSGLAPIVGVYGISLAVALGAGLLWALVGWRGRARLAAAAGLTLIWLAGAAVDRIEWTRADGKAFRATVVQANIPQAVKWDPDTRVSTLRAYVELTRENWSSDLVVWPETAVPDFLHAVREGLIEPLAQEARENESELVLGIPVVDFETRRYYNALLSIGSVEDSYYKRHLVPFGEFIPFKAALGSLAKAFDVPMSDFSAGSDGRPLLRVGPHLAGVSICYEDVFPAEVIEALPEAAYLINVSNDAWFGDSAAPHQHLQMARMRARETERWLVRATNTGISAILDHRGAPVGTLPLFERGTLSAEVQPRRGATPFARVGNWPAIGSAALMLVAALWFGLRARGTARA